MTQEKLKNLLDDIFDGPRRIQFSDHGARYIRLGDLESGEIYFDPHQTTAPQNLDIRYYLRPGDVLVSKTGDEPRSVVVPEEASGALIAPDIYCLRIIPGRLSATWLAYFLNTSYGKQQLIKRSTGATIRRLHMADIRSMPLLLPAQQLVEKIEALEYQAQVNSQTAHEILATIIFSMYAEINEHSNYINGSNPTAFLSSSTAQKAFRPLSEVARIAVSSRKMLKPDQLVNYVQVSDIDQQSFLFRRLRIALAKDLPSRIRLPLQSFQVLLLASGSNLGTPAHPVAVIDNKLSGGFASNAFLALEFNETPIYYAIALKHPVVLEQIKRMAVGKVVSTLRKKDIVHLRIPILSTIWRQDFNDRAQLAWERRALALNQRREALDMAEAFIQSSLAETST